VYDFLQTRFIYLRDVYKLIPTPIYSTYIRPRIRIFLGHIYILVYILYYIHGGQLDVELARILLYVYIYTQYARLAHTVASSTKTYIFSLRLHINILYTANTSVRILIRGSQLKFVPCNHNFIEMYTYIMFIWRIIILSSNTRYFKI